MHSVNTPRFSAPHIRSPWLALPICAALGVLQGWALAWPFGVEAADWTAAHLRALWPQPGQPLPLLQWLVMSAWLVLLQAAPSSRDAFWRSWCFATAWLCGTFWWLFISMHTYGDLPAALAGVSVWLLALFLALYAAGAGWAYRALWCRHPLAATVALPALWTLAELARAQWFTGFPWGAVGYAHVNLLGWAAPWVGVYGMGALAAALASLTAWFWADASRPRARAPVLGVALVLAWVLAPAFARLAAEPTQTHGVLPVVVLQGNIPQGEKFDAARGIPQALAWYREQLTQVPKPSNALVIAPETAIPILPQGLDAPEWAAWLQPLSRSRHAVLLGVPLGTTETGYSNSAWALGPAEAEQTLQALARGVPPQAWHTAEGATGIYTYSKHHLVPFGEFIPPLFRWFVALMDMPLGDFNRGSLGQAPWTWNGQRIAPHICYEDLFGEELAQSFTRDADAPTVLVNLSNLAWFNTSVALDQHLHIARLRAMELGRPMVRSTNTGATVVIDHRGRVTHALPRATAGRLEASVEGRQGLTPYARWASRWGLAPLWVLAVLWVVASVGWARWQASGVR